MTTRVWLCLAFSLTVAGLAGAENAPGNPGGGRLLMSFDIEVLTVKPDDAATITRWGELASIGYHVVGTTVAAQGATVLYLERAGSPGVVRAPSMIAKDPGVADIWKTRIAAAQAQEQPAAVQAAIAPQSSTK